MTVHEAINILRNTVWLDANKNRNEDKEKTEQAIEIFSKALEEDCKLIHWYDGGGITIGY